MMKVKFRGLYRRLKTLWYYRDNLTVVKALLPWTLTGISATGETSNKNER